MNPSDERRRDRSGSHGPRVGLWTRLRDIIERRFERWGHFVSRHAWATIAVVLLFVGALASQVPKLVIDTSTEGFLAKSDPVRIAYDDFRRLFGRDEILVLAIEGEDVFDFTFLERLRALHEAVEDEVPKLEEVTSLLNARYTRGIGDELVVGDFLEDWPETEEDLETLRRRALDNPLYVDQLISADTRLTTVLIQTDAYTSIGYESDEADALRGFDDPASDAGDVVDAQATRTQERPFLTGEENTAIVNAVREVVAQHATEGFRIHVAGNPVMIDQMMSAMLKDMARFSGLALLVIGLLLMLLFRNVKAVALSLVVSVLAVVTSLGVMALIGTPLTSATQIMPSFLLAVGVGNSVHVLVIYFQSRSRGDDREAALAYALGHSGLAIVMTALTTAGGLASFITADIAPVADLGWICPVGTMAALFFSLVLLPALIAVVPMGPSARAGFGDRSFLRRVPVWFGDVGTRTPVAVALVWGVILATSCFGIAQVRFSHDPIKWFAPDDPIRVATELVNDELKGSIFLEVVVDTGRENGLHDPDILNRLEAIQRTAEETTAGQILVGKTMSLADVTKEIHEALNENRADHYVIPQDPALVAQELLLFENAGSDDLEDFVDSQFRLGRVTLKLPMVDAIGFREFFAKIEPRLEAVLDGRATHHITGNWSILGRTINALIDSLSSTYVMAFGTITPLMVLLLGSFRLGLLSMLPNVAAIVVTVGVMGWFGIPLDAFTLMIGSIALGLAVDDTIHFMHNFRRAFSRMGDATRAVHATLETTGQALFFTSLTLTAGFFIYMLASMKNLFYFGLLTGVAISVAFLANVTLAPALVTLVARSGAKGLLEARDGEEEGAGAASEMEGEPA